MCIYVHRIDLVRSMIDESALSVCSAGQDYTAVTTSVTFGSAAGDRQCISIPITSDNIPSEPDETFMVTLDLPTPDRPDVIPDLPDMATVIISGIAV